MSSAPETSDSDERILEGFYNFIFHLSFQIHHHLYSYHNTLLM